MKVITWNIDGCDPNQMSETISRTNRAIKILKEYDIIFLQEVMRKTNNLIQSQMQQYYFYEGECSKTRRGYHVAILVKKSIVKSGGYPEYNSSAEWWENYIKGKPRRTFTAFSNSAMGRGILSLVFTTIDEKRDVCS